MNNSNNKLKKAVAENLLAKGEMFIHFDSRVQGVIAPPQWMNKEQVIFQVGYNMKIPIPDLEVTDHGIRGTLSFSGSRWLCAMPWESIYVLASQDGMGKEFPEQFPPNVQAAYKAQERQEKVQPVEILRPDFGKPRTARQTLTQRRPNAPATPSFLRVVK